MFYKTSVYIADILEQQNKFAPEDKEVYRYGIQQGLNLTLNILTTIIIGVLCGMVYPSLMFLICYMPLRSFCGGYHAKTHLRCYIYSVIMITCILLVAKYTTFNIVLYEILVLISLIIILLLAPVEDENKKLDNVEKCICRSQNRNCTDLEPSFNGYKTAHLPLLNRTNVYERTFRANVVYTAHPAHSARTFCQPLPMTAHGHCPAKSEPA